jgi:hypothetical protein
LHIYYEIIRASTKDDDVIICRGVSDYLNTRKRTTANTTATTTTAINTFMLLPLGSFGGFGASVGTDGPGTTAAGPVGSTGAGVGGVETGGVGAGVSRGAGDSTGAGASLEAGVSPLGVPLSTGGVVPSLLLKLPPDGAVSGAGVSLTGALFVSFSLTFGSVCCGSIV